MPDNASALITHLLSPTLYSDSEGDIQLIETHISWVILAGPWAYKIKKPINLGFLDFSTLERRHHYCQQELSLNQRLAPEVYHEVISITGSVNAPRLEGSGPAIEYAVKMKRFPADAQLDDVLAAGRLNASHIDQLADTLAEFHHKIERASADSHFGSPQSVMHAALQNFHQLSPLIDNDSDRQHLERLQRWTESTFNTLSPTISMRKKEGFVRNCHGDMHLANMALIDNRVVIFDCIEFNDDFRWMDTISEVAFVTMDLSKRDQHDFASRLLNRYLEMCGDYAGLQLLRFYQVYYAMVRAKVTAIRSQQPELGDMEQQYCTEQYRQYIALAEHFARQTQGTLLIAHGVSGSGKTTLTQPLLEKMGMIRLRSDVERKRLFGLAAQTKSGSGLNTGIYSHDAGEKTYQHLAGLAAHVIESGYSVIVDATFLKQADRARFRQQAETLKVKFVILHFHAPLALLKQWIEERSQKGVDASEATIAVLEKQLASEEPLNDDEADAVIRIDTQFSNAYATLIQAVKTLRAVQA